MNKLTDLEARIKELLPDDVSLDELVARTQDAWDKADVTQREKLDLVWRGARAREFTLDGWKNFYWCIMRREYPDAHLPLINALMDAVKTKRAKMVQAWRGFGKSTDLLLFVLWMVGINPVGSTGFVRINDTKAQLTGDVVSEIIETHKGWLACFPYVIPDKEAGWSSEKGYNVLDTRETENPINPEKYAEWRQKCLADHPTESSIMCAGIESGSIIGWHPTNGMYFDDLHDERNTRSALEMQKIVDIVEKNVIPTWFTPKGRPVLACVCTPWDSLRDSYHSFLQTGLFDLVKIPIYTEDENGILFEPKNIKIKLTWEEAFPLEQVEVIWKASAKNFEQMYLLDEDAAKEVTYTYRTFPHTEIKSKEWILTVGVDPIGEVSGVSSGKGVSHFAMSYVLETPYNSLVVWDGYVKKTTTDVAETALVNFIRDQPNFKSASIEKDGGGALFIGTLTRNVGLKINPHSVKEIGIGSKKERQFRFLESLFSNGILLVSDADTNYLNILRSALRRYPNIQNNEPEMDVLDSLCMAVLDIPRVWTRIHTNIIDPSKLNRRIESRQKPNLGNYRYLQ